jgi:SAM-dependent methyltransferase
MSPEQELSALASRFGVPMTGERVITLHPPFGAATADDGASRRFDCVIAGGNISWWDGSERQYLWDFLKSRLSDDGVVFLYVDSYPGARCLDMIRDIARIHCIDINRETIPGLLGILKFLADESQHPAQRLAMRSQLEEFQATDRDRTVRRLAFDRKVYSLAELEALASSLGLQCDRLEPAFRGEQWVVLQRQRVEPQFEDPPASTIAKGEDLDLPYPEYLHSRTSPESIASTAYAFGLDPVDPRRSRVLELGCGTGLSLLTFASAYPDASFFGLDLSEASIAIARAATAAAGIRNVRFEAMDILDFGKGEEVGEFDYILAHGVHSWTPEPVRSQVLRICDRYLSRNGVAFVSFNARPGYHINLMLRDAGLWFARNADNLMDRSQKALHGLRTMDFSAFPVPGVSELVASRLREIEEDHPMQCGFDEFGDINSPVLFSSFIEEVRGNHLKYVTEAEIFDWTSMVFSQAAQGLLSQLESDPLRRMDYRDLVRLNTFHAALVVREDGPARPSASPVASRLPEMLVSAGAFPVSPRPDVRGATEERFETARGDYVEIADACVKGFLVALCGAEPLRLPLSEAIRRAADLAGVDPQSASTKIRHWFQMFWESGFIRLHRTPCPAAAGYGERPAVFPVARRHAARTGKVPTLTRGLIPIEDETEGRLMQLADGTRTVTELTRDAGLEAAEVERILAKWVRLGLFLPAAT